MTNKELGNRLKHLKNKAGVTIEELSRASGVGKSTIDRILNGRTENPNLQTIAMLVEAMGFSLDDVTMDDVDVPCVNDVVQSTDYPKDDAYLASVEYLHRRQIAELKSSYEQHVKDLRRNRDTWCLVACVLIAIMIIYIFLDALNPAIGMIR